MKYHVTFNSNSTETYISANYFMIEESCSVWTFHGWMQQSINEVASRLYCYHLHKQAPQKWNNDYSNIFYVAYIKDLANYIDISQKGPSTEIK